MADQLIIRDMSGDASGQNLGRVAWLTSNRTALKGEYILARNSASAKLNTANPFAPVLGIVGAPDYGDEIFAGAALSQGNWFDTKIRDAQELTMMVAYKPSAGQSVLIGNFNGDNGVTTTSLLLTDTGVKSQAPATDVAQETDSVAVPAIYDGWTIAAMRTTGLANFTIKTDIFRAGERIGGAVKNTFKNRLVVPAGPAFAIGSARGSAGLDVYKGSASFLFADIWYACLTDEELLAVAREWFAMGRACGQVV